MMKILFVKNSEIYSGGFYARAALRRTGRTSSGGLSSGKNQCAYIAYFRLMAHGRVYETSLGGNGKFLRGSFKCGLFYAAGGNASPFLVKTRKLTDVGEAHLRSHRGNGKLAAFQQGVRFG